MLAGLGASASLAAAGALALLVLSAVIALEGFPGMSPDAGGRSLAVADLTVGTTDPTTAAVAPDRLVAVGPDTAAPAGAAPVPDGGAPGSAIAPGDPDPGATPPADSPVPGGGPGPGPGDGPGPVVTGPGEDVDRGPLPVSLPEEPVRELTDTTGGLVGDTGEQLAPMVDAILPGSGGLVRGTTALLDQTVRNTGEVLGGTVEGLLGG